MHVRKKFDYVGVDETTAGLDWDSFIVVAAETQMSSLAETKPYGSLRKARDYFRDAIAEKEPGEKVDLTLMPSFDELRASGLETFYWARARPGKLFNRPEIEHGIIPHIVTHNGYTPQNTVVLVDGFHTNYAYSAELLYDCFHARGFNIPRQNIEIHGGGDISVPIINYADLIAFQIGLLLAERYDQYSCEKLRANLSDEIPYDQRRTVPLQERDRAILENILSPATNHRE